MRLLTLIFRFIPLIYAQNFTTENTDLETPLENNLEKEDDGEFICKKVGKSQSKNVFFYHNCSRLYFIGNYSALWMWPFLLMDRTPSKKKNLK